tara:strand:+ start:1439 stop:2374 length:936 start_codon:yes stop_codon:yes gene_type:complete
MKYADKIKFLTNVFGESKLQNDEVELTVRCPKCGKPGKKKLCIRLDSDLYHCWVCNIRGRNVAKLIQMKKPNLVSEYMQRFKPAGFTYNNSLSIPEFDPIVLPEGFNLIMESLHDPDAIAIRKYAHSRGITDQMLWRYRIGYSDDWKLRRRLIIPSFDSSGDINYWVARAIDSDAYIKYVNAKAPKVAIIFNEIDLDFTQPVYLVEGPLDLVKCINLNSTCLLGSSLSENSLLFYELAANNTPVILCLDPDAKKKQDNIADLLASYNLEVSYLNLTEGDVGDLSPKEVVHLVSKPVKWNENSNLLNRIQEL